MTTTRRRSVLDMDLAFRSTNRSMAVRVQGIMLEISEGEVCEARLTLHTDHAGLVAIENAGDFHLTPDVRLPGASEGFNRAAPISIEIQLDPALATGLPADTDAVVEQLINASSQSVAGPSPLLDPASWYALSVKQSRGDVSTGYATKWFTRKHTNALGPSAK